MTLNDPIRFVISTNKQNVTLGEEVEITVTAQYMQILPSQLFVVEGANAFRLKVILPEGFIQTGGDYVDYIGTELSPVKPQVSYSIKGHFNRSGKIANFRLLRGNSTADAASLFVEKDQVLLHIDTSRNKGARAAGDYANVNVDCGNGTLSVTGTLTTNNGQVGILIFKDGAIVSSASDLPATNFNRSFPINGPGSYYAKVREVNNDGNYVDSQVASVNCSGGTTNPPTNPPPPLSNNGSLTFEIVSYDCNSGVLQYRFSSADSGTPINVTMPGVFGGTMNAFTVATYTFPSDGRIGRTVTGTATQSGHQIAINFTNGCNMAIDPGNNPGPNPNNCTITQGQFLLNFNGEAIYAHQYNGVWFAAYQDGSNFKARNWLQAAGYNQSNCFTDIDPRTPSYSPCGTGKGLISFFSNSIDMSTHLVGVRVDRRINFIWNASPIPGMVNPDGFSIRWFGKVEAPVSGLYTFKTNNDDGTRLWINNQLLIDDWNGHAPTWQQGTIYLNAGQKYPIVMDYFDLGGGAQAQLYWEYPGQSLEIVPSCRLYTETETNTNVNYNVRNTGGSPCGDSDNGIEYIVLGCATVYACNPSGNIFEINLSNCADGSGGGGSGGGGSGGGGSGDTPINPPGSGGGGYTPTGGTGVPGGPKQAGGYNFLYAPKFSIYPVQETVEEAYKRRFYSSMNSMGITFTTQEQIFLNENVDLIGKVSEYVNQFFRKPNLDPFTLDINTASTYEILRAGNALIPAQPNLDFLPQGERALLGEGTAAYHSNALKWLADARWATIRATIHYGWYQAQEDGESIGNAFKHAMFACYHAESFGRQLAAQIAEAHEGGSEFPDSQMDRWNNAEGFKVWDAGHRNMNIIDYQIWTATSEGKLRYIKDKDNKQLIPTNQ